MKSLIPSSFIFGLSVMLFACQSKSSEENTKPKKVVMELPAPFQKHLKVEVGPELIFDVFSWGRGSDSTSSLLILRSDSLKNEFSVASSDNIDGRLQEVFNTDMDDDNNPEIVVYYTLNDKYESAEVMCFEFNGKNVNKIRFPDLSSKTKKQYHGLDDFYVKEGKLFREFNIYDEADTLGKNALEKKKIQYFLKNNNFDLKELE
ncbi:MAG: hypothetical protein KKE39_01115 [Bacteroidetes bacterium]|nr:hypothetical protein [Bacteroidota bacterium]MBU1372192.1 hypothetical protein [Bacteroidota bacterium]MBU1483330.1 hypothetical protein [Bacteroidota bacterium]MBU1760350.1 hypothetical protein [Bacteroidota bacterium]MBU2045301.1 hypothetical protein [Bacteroidota bacterium]